MNNKAKSFGGGLHIQLQSSGININKAIIIRNTARIGGGIYLDADFNLNNNNFFESLLWFNTAEEYGNNIKEIPNHLTFVINQKENPSKPVLFNNEWINKLDLKRYRMTEQGNQISTKDLLIPSNQVLKNFKIFDIHSSNFKPFIEDISLVFKNSRNEKMDNLFNSSCEVKRKIIEKDQQEQVEEVNQILFFNNEKNSFDFGSLSFSLDPYQQNYSHLQIEISCQIKESTQKLKYILNAKTLKCQLGEFYVDNGCQICQSKRGYYSVTYNATKCSIFNKDKYSDITSNMIQLLPGFWRPNNFSDLVEPCFKNPLFCNGGWQAIQEPYAKNVIYIILGVMEIILKTNGINIVQNVNFNGEIYYHFQQAVFGRQYLYQCHQEVSLDLTHYINHQQLLKNLVKYYLNQIKIKRASNQKC
ncbi:unnamed protein product [Paramecium sonneborni]|uniref:Uncharacterized protein n=1 Tax=Paramecium sonneborni TaxID=65129 RepID=A0A8S1MXX9_9CILI|nr:unnamed protein product [Paramecium sonneborni]